MCFAAVWRSMEHGTGWQHSWRGLRLQSRVSTTTEPPMRYVKTVIVNPPNPSGFVSNKDSMGGFGQLYPKGAPPFPPLDIPYLAAFLLERRLEVSVIEGGALDLSISDLCGRLN